MLSWDNLRNNKRGKEIEWYIFTIKFLKTITHDFEWCQNWIKEINRRKWLRN